MNRFKKHISDSEKAEQNLLLKMEKFSDDMQEAMELNQSDIDKAGHLSDFKGWTTKNWRVSVRSSPLNSWKNMLVACPKKDDATKYGYTNCNETPPVGWEYVPSGTATIFVPDKLCQLDILTELKQ